MTQVIIQPTARGRYEAGDVAEVWTTQQIRKMAAQRLLLPHKRGEERPYAMADPYREIWCESVMQYRWERFSRHGARRIERASGDDVIINEPRLQSMLDRCYATKRFPMFGPRGSEVWYTGREQQGAALDVVWQGLAQIGFPETVHAQMIVPPGALRRYLILGVDVSDEEALTWSLIPDAEDIQRAGRADTPGRCRYHVQWQSVAGVNVAAVRDPKRMTDYRHLVQPRDAVRDKWRM